MPVDFQKFVDWAMLRIPPIEIKGNEIRANSIFTEDLKKHLWCNPLGGKNKVEYGVYHCWKSEKKGTLVNLVMQVDNCSFKEALSKLGIIYETMVAPEEIDFNFETEPDSSFENYDDLLQEIQFPPNTTKLSVAPMQWYNKAKKYLEDRKIYDERFYFCTNGAYGGRVIIPYYSLENKLIYFNGRTIIDSPLRYKGPAKEIGVGKEDVLFFTHYPPAGQTIYLCEGEFDALSLSKTGLAAAACGGKNLSDKQAVQLSPYKVCLALDSDQAGQDAMQKMRNKIIQYGHPNIKYVKPPTQYKDWNNVLINHNEKILRNYVNSTEKTFDGEASYVV